MDITNTSALVTGGSQGLGRALGKALAQAGARVVLVARHRDRLDETVEEIRSLGGKVYGITADIGEKTAVHPIAGEAAALVGPIDILIQNASTLGPVPLRLLLDTDCEDLERALATNLVGPFRLTKAVLGALSASAREGRGAVVLNISSDAAINAYPTWGAYSASKAALHHLSRIWDEELSAEGVRVLSADPGDMDTPLHALAVPDADPATLKRPEDAARDMLALIADALPRASESRVETAQGARGVA